MAAAKKKSNVVLSSMLKKIDKDVKEMGGQELVIKGLEKNIKTLTEKVDKSIGTNIELQEKVTELMLYLIELVKNVQGITKLLSGGSLQQIRKEGHSGESNVDLSEQLSVLANQNKELTETLRSLESQLKKDDIKEAIKRALERAENIK